MIRKWRLYPVDEPHEIPGEAMVIHVGEQDLLPVVWTNDVATLSGVLPYHVQVFITGATPPEEAVHLGSVQIGGWVGHVFRVEPEYSDGRVHP